MIFGIVRRGALALALVLAPALLAAQTGGGTVRGRVVDAASGSGVPEAQVVITGTRIGAVTGAGGDFTLVAVPTGARSVTARRIGYQPATAPVTVAAERSRERAVRAMAVVPSGEERGVSPTPRASGARTALSRPPGVGVDPPCDRPPPGVRSRTG